MSQLNVTSDFGSHLWLIFLTAIHLTPIEKICQFQAVRFSAYSTFRWIDDDIAKLTRLIFDEDDPNTKFSVVIAVVI